MKRSHDRVPISGGRRAAWFSAFSLCAAALILALLYRSLRYIPLLLAVPVLALPAVLDLLLLLTRPHTPPTQEKPPVDAEAATDAVTAEETPTAEKPAAGKRFRSLFRCAGTRVTAFLTRHRDALLLLLLLVAVVVANVAFWRGAVRDLTKYRMTYVAPVVLAALFVAFVVFEKWCKHAAANEDAYTAALLGSLRCALISAQVTVGLTAITATVKLLGFYDAVRILHVLLCLLFAYETAFYLISSTVRFIRRELQTAPDISAPMPGLGGKDLGVLTYLEKNTGITMRSLWGIIAIRRFLPYGILFAVVLTWFITGVSEVESHQRGALYRFGKLQDVTLEPGLHLTLPWPFDKVEVYDTDTVRKLTIGYAGNENSDNLWTDGHEGEYKLLLGGGKELVSVNLRIEYRITDLHAYLTGNAAPERLLEAAAYEAVTDRTINTDLETLLSADRAALAEEFRATLSAAMEERGTGLAVVSVVLESIHPPVEVAEVYQNAIGAGIECEQLILEAEAKAGETVSWANATRISDINDALAAQYADVANARSAVAEFMAGVEADAAYSDEYRYHKYLTAVRNAYSGAKLVIVGEGIDSSNLYIGNFSGN